MPVRFGFVGLDHWYNAFPTLDALARNSEATIVALAHRDPARAAEVAARYDVPALPSYDDVIGRDDIDVICSFTSADENASVAVRTINAGKALLAIKPMAMNLAEADEVVAAVRARNGRYFPNDAARRFFPAVIQMRAWLQEGRIGDLLAGHCLFRAGLPRAWPEATTPGWFADPARVPGGAFLDHAVYHVDLLRWLFDSEVASVQGLLANVRYPELALEDYGKALLRFQNGGVGSIEDTWTSGPGASKESLELIGSRGALSHDTATGRLALTGDFGLAGWLQVAPPTPRGGLTEHVIRCMRDEEEPVATVEDARTNLAVCLAVYQAAREGRTVTLPAAPA